MSLRASQLSQTGRVAAAHGDERLAPADGGARKLDERREALELAIGRLPANHVWRDELVLGPAALEIRVG